MMFEIIKSLVDKLCGNEQDPGYTMGDVSIGTISDSDSGIGRLDADFGTPSDDVLLVEDIAKDS